MGRFSKPFNCYNRLTLVFFYWRRLRGFDLPENRVGWISRHNQEIRFEKLIEIGDLQNSKILDLGCGLGCLYGYLKSHGWRGDYTGIDLLPSMVKEARIRFPEARFEVRDILENPTPEQWDYVLISGIFNHRVHDNWEWMEQIMKAVLKSARKGAAFNVLSSESGWWDSELFYAPPAGLERKANEWSAGKYKLVRGYLPEDLTVYLYL
jgi:SAM-dependent methyltransferase